MRGRASTTFWKLAHSPMKQNEFSPVLTSDPPRKPLRPGFHAAVLRYELLLMAGLDAKPHDIECRHIVHPTVKA